jgi:hypothetical protein
MSHNDLEKGDAMTDAKLENDSTTMDTRAPNNFLKHSTWAAKLSISIPLLVAYTSLYITNYYLSPAGPGAEHREGDEGRIAPLVIVLMLLGPDLIQKAFAVTTTSSQTESPCFGFGWLAYSASLLVQVASGSSDLLPKPEFELSIADMKTGKSRSNTSFMLCQLLRNLEFRYTPSHDDSDLVIQTLQPIRVSPARTSFKDLLQNRSMVTVLSQFCLAGAFWYYYGDLSVLLLLSTSVLLLEATASLPIWSSQKQLFHGDGARNSSYAMMREIRSSPQRIFIFQPPHPDPFSVQDTAAPSVSYGEHRHTNSIAAVILVSGGFLSQALLYTQLSDNAAAAMLVIMLCGTISNMVIVALPREPEMDGVKLHSVDMISGDGGIVEALSEVEGKFEGFGEMLLRKCFPERLGEWGEWKETKVKMGEMD